MVAQQREDSLRLAEARRAAENPPMEQTQDLLEKYKAAEAKQQERDRRLGLDPGKFIYHYSGLCLWVQQRRLLPAERRDESESHVLYRIRVLPTLSQRTALVIYCRVTCGIRGWLNEKLNEELPKHHESYC